MLRSREGRDSVLTYVAEGISVIGIALAYRFAAQLGKQDMDLYVIVRRSVSFVYPLILLGAVVAVTRSVAMRSDPADQRRLLFGAFTWIVPISGLVVIFCWIASAPLARSTFGSSDQFRLIPPLGVMIAGFTLYSLCYAFLRGQKRNVQANVMQVIAMAVAPLSAFVLFDELRSICWATGLVWLFLALVVIVPLLGGAPIGRVGKERTSLLRYGLPRLPGDLAFGALLTLPVYFVARTHGLSASGEIGFGTTLLNLAGAVFAPLSVIILPAAAAQLAQGDHARLSGSISNLMRYTLLTSAAMVILFESAAGPILHLYLGENYAQYVPMGRLVFLGTLPFSLYISMRSVLDAYFHTPRNGINLLGAFMLFMIGGFVHLLVPSPPMVVAVALIISLGYLGWATWRDVRFVRSELDRLVLDRGRGIRILVVIPARADQTTAYPFARRQAEAFRNDHGAHVTVFHLESRTSLWRLWRERVRFKRLLRDERPDVVHAHYGSVSALFTVLSSSVPVVVNFHGSDLNRTPQDGWLRDLMGRVFSQFAAFFSAGIICVSEPLRQRLWWRNEEAVVLPMGVDPRTFKPLPRNECRAALGWDPMERVVLFNANNPQIKRLDIAEAVLARLRRKDPHVRLEVLRGSVHPDKVPVLMNACDALLLCSDMEGSPTMVKEAMACGLPVVSSDVGDVRERTLGAYPGAITAQEPEALASALEEVLRTAKRSNGPELLKANNIDARVLDERTYAYLGSILFRT